MAYETVIFRGGIESKLIDDRWHLSNEYADAPVSFPTWEAIAQVLGTPPVALVGKDTGFGERGPSLVNPRTGSWFGVEVTELLNRPTPPGTLGHIRRLQYGLGAMVYHCTHLAEVYVHLCRRMAAISRIPGMMPEGAGGLLGGNEEPNFEFDALVTVARRIYDAPAGLVWRTFAARRDEAPKRIETVLQRLDNMPDALRTQLLRSWNDYGKVAREYRNCILHYTDTEFGFGSVHMLKHPLGVRSAFARIPDNPEARSRNKFTYQNERDALNYSLDLTAEVTAYLTAIVEAVTSTTGPSPGIAGT
jgi:hypothetical protein